MPPYYGKFRAIVVDNDDPLRIARLQVNVVEVMGDGAAWAMPCAPYRPAPPTPSELPPPGSHVWVEFEGGDPVYPVWAGCYWVDLPR